MINLKLTEEEYELLINELYFAHTTNIMEFNNEKPELIDLILKIKRNKYYEQLER